MPAAKRVTGAPTGSPKGYFIATTPRTGGWLLCDYLRGTGVAGLPGEYASTFDEASWRMFHGFDSHRAYYESLRLISSTPNGVAGLKFFWGQLLLFGEEDQRFRQRSADIGTCIYDMLGPYIAIKLGRADQIAQAVSWVRARLSGVWSVRVGMQPQGRPVGLDDYHSGLISDALDAIRWQERNWSEFLSRLGVTIIDLSYESVVLEPASVLKTILSALNVFTDGMALPKPRLVKQADEISRVWTDRARRDFP